MNKLKKYIKSHKKTSLFLLLVIVFLGYMVFYGNKEEESLRQVFTPVSRGSITTVVSGTGQVESSSQVDLKSDVSGKIVYVGVNPGDFVSRGKVLFGIDSTNAEKSVRDAEVNLESAKSQQKFL